MLLSHWLSSTIRRSRATATDARIRGLQRRRNSEHRFPQGLPASVELLENRAMLSGVSCDVNEHGPAGVDVPFGMFTSEEIEALESVPFDSNFSSKTPAAAEDGGHASDVLTFVLDFKEPSQGSTFDIFGNLVTDFDIVSFGFTASDFNLVANAILAELDEDYFDELIGTVAGPLGRDLDVDFIIGDIGTAPAGVTEYYYVQIGTGVAGPHTGGTLGVAGGSVVRNASGNGPNGVAVGDVVSSVFTDAIVTLGGLSPANALTSGNIGFTTHGIGGTLAHEIGHTLSLSHINKAGSVQPTPGVSPLMGTGAIDLPNGDRITDREFSISGVDGENGDAPRRHIEQLRDAVGLHQVGGGTWVAQGPAPGQDGQVENISPNDEVVGSIHTVLAHPTDASILYVGASNGGVWRTNNATDASPTWFALTDALPSLSIGALQFDPTDATGQTLIAGVGRYSSFGRAGGERAGLLRTTDGGSTWTVLDGAGSMVGRNVSGVAARGNTIVASVNVADSFTFPEIGIFRSTDGGVSFTQISSGNGSSTGLPGGASYDLAADPTNNSVLYTSMIFADIVGGQNGIYRSTDTGATWTKVSDAVIDALLSGNTSNLEISVGTSNNVYAAVINNGNPAGFFRSGNGGSTWTQMDTPQTNENGTNVGLNPKGIKGPGPGSAPEEIAGGQGGIHFSIIADPNDANTVYVGGDRQPRTFGDTGGFPNSIGAADFSGRLFRGDASAATGSQWEHLTHSNTLGAAGGGTANSTSPHADSREIVFDANGNIIEVDDGGVYRRTSPQDNTGDWFSIIGNLQVTEAHDVAYDPISDILISGNQDTGTTEQISSGSQTWRSVSTADGGDVVIDSITLAASGQSIRYSSFQNLGGFRRRVVDSNNNVVSTTFPALSVTSGPAFDAMFDTPIALNAVDPQRIIFGGDNGLYESLNQGSSIAQIAASVVTADLTSNPIAYGGRLGIVPNLDVVYAGGNDGRVHIRTAAAGAFTATDPDPSAGSTQGIRDVRMDPDDWQTAVALDDDQVFFTPNAGGTWADITGDLATVGGAVLRSLEYISGPVDAILAGTNLGVFISLVTSLGTWTEFGAGLPNVPVWDMDYDATDDILAVGTLGRGVWTLPNASTLINPSAGAVEFDASLYAIGDAVTITVSDIDLAGGGPISVVVASDGGDSESVTLIETGSGIFQGSIASTAAVASPASGVLEVAAGDQITVTYNDADDGTGNPATVQDTAVFTVLSNLLVADFSDAGGNPFNEGFTISGPSNEWHLSVGRGSDPGHTADDSFYFGSGETAAGGGVHANNADGTLTSPVIDLTFALTAELMFNHFLESEQDFDFATVSVIHGATTTEIATSDAGLLPVSTTGFESITLNLSAFVGQEIQIAFRFTSDISVVNEGWYIDDVVVRATLAPPLQVTGVKVSGSTWNANFKDVADGEVVGTGLGQGFSIPTGSNDQTVVLPWNRVNRLIVTFTEPVDETTVTANGNVIVHGVNSTPNISLITFDGNQMIIDLAGNLPTDSLRLEIQDTVLSTAGAPLDGDFINNTDTLPSGGSAGVGNPVNNFNFQFVTNPGDANRSGTVNISDAIIIFQHFFATPAIAGYSMFADMTGDAILNISDAVVVFQNFFAQPPSAPPPLLFSPGAGFSSAPPQVSPGAQFPAPPPPGSSAKAGNSSSAGGRAAAKTPTAKGSGNQQPDAELEVLDEVLGDSVGDVLSV